jgi:hypothetical protein
MVDLWKFITFFFNPGMLTIDLFQPFSVFLPWRNPWNNFQVSGNPCIKIIISTAHGKLAWSVSCRYNNPVIIVSAVLSRELYFFLWICLFWPTISKNDVFFHSRSLAEHLATSRGTLWFRGTSVEEPWSILMVPILNINTVHSWIKKNIYWLFTVIFSDLCDGQVGYWLVGDHFVVLM